jgi:pimeloyl-ACP methyl ester carboxylesterase
VTISVDGLKIAYNRTGNGKTVLLLHGWGVSGDNMSEIMNELKRGFDVISLDLPGFGDSQEPVSAWRLEQYVLCIEALLEHLKVKDLYAVIGHSFGGRLVIKSLAENTLQPKKAVLIGAAGIKHSQSIRNVAYKIIAKIGKRVLSLPWLGGSSAALRHRLYAAAGSQDYLAASGIMKQIFKNVINEDLSEAARSVTLPTLLIWGSEDESTPLRDARFFHEVMPKSGLKIVQEAGHFVHNEKPKKVNKWIRLFLES